MLTQFLPIESSDSRVEIRAVTRDESDLVLQLMCRCFALDYESAKTIFYSDPFFDLTFKRGVFDRDSGQLISCLTVIPTYLRTGTKSSAILPIAGIAGVCTEPQFRGQGFARALIRRTVAALAGDLGFCASALTAERPDYYRDLGWDICAESVQWSTSNFRTFPAYYESEDVRVLTSGEVAAKASDIHKLYAQAHSNSETGSFVRDERRWKCIERLSMGRRIALYERDGLPRGYFAFQKRSGNESSTVVIDEFAAPTEDAKRALIGYLGTGKIGFAISGICRHADLEWLQRLASTPFATETNPNLYLRVTHLSRLVSHLTSNMRPSALLTKRSGFAIAIEPSGLPEDMPMGASACSVKAVAGKVTVDPISAVDLRTPSISGDSGAITQMLFGYKLASWLMSEGRIRSTYPEMAEICDSLFSPINPFLAPPDQF